MGLGRWSWWLGAAAAVLAFIFLKYRLLELGPGRVFPDTLEYVRVAGLPITDAAFWGSLRPPILPLLYKLLAVGPDNYELASIIGQVGSAQTLISCAAWIALAGVVGSLMRIRWLQSAAFVAMLAFGLNLHVAQWDAVLLSESLATSLFVAWLGTFLLLVHKRRSGAGVGRLASVSLELALGLLSLLLALVRDLNAYLMLGMLGLAVVGLLTPIIRTKAKNLLVVMLPVFILAGVLSVVSSNHGQRWKIPLLGVLHERIFTNAQATAFFESAGMPVGKWEKVPVTREGRAFFLSMVQYDPEAEPFEHWIESRGRMVYANYLLTHPRALIGGPLRHVPKLLSPDSTEYRGPLAESPRWLVWMTALLFPMDVWIEIALILLVLAAMGWQLKRGVGKGWWAVPVALLAISPLLLGFVWHADSIEVERHAYPIAMQVRLAAWILAFGVVDSIILSGSSEMTENG